MKFTDVSEAGSAKFAQASSADAGPAGKVVLDLKALAQALHDPVLQNLSLSPPSHPNVGSFRNRTQEWRWWGVL